MSQGGSKVVVVTGASSGLGREICLDLANANCRLVGVARRVERLSALCKEINAAAKEGEGVRALAVELDISGGDCVIEAAVNKAWNAFGRVDVLINNAGTLGELHSPLEMPEEEWNKVISTNLTGTWLVSKVMCKLMRDHKIKRGSVINISSITGLSRGLLPEVLAYSTSKAGINMLTKNIALEVGQFGIRVNSISPGIFESEMSGDLMRTQGIHNVPKRIIPLRTFGVANPAITSLVRYLIDDASEYVSGNVFIVDAGESLPGIPLFSSL